MGTKKSWCENDRMWAATESLMFGERMWQEAPSEVDQILKFLELDFGAKILDLCCGQGRHSLELARRGYSVTGVDRASLFLDKAKEKARGEGLEVEFVLEDMRNFRRPEAFEAAISMFTSFGYFDDPGEERKVIDNIYDSLKKGGRFVLELMGKEILAKKFQARDWVEKDGLIMLEERIASSDWTYLDNRWILIEGAKREEFHLRLRIYSAYELSSLLKDAGFSEISVYGDMDGGDYGNTARRMITVAQK